jgi:hypothetical protein
MPEKVQVLYVKKLPSGMCFAHVHAGRFYGDVPCAEDVQEGPVVLHHSLGVKAGRMVSFLKVYPEGSE